METTIRIHSDALTPQILEGIKAMFPHKTIDITVSLADATDEILSNAPFAQELRSRIADFGATGRTIAVNADDL